MLIIFVKQECPSSFGKVHCQCQHYCRCVVSIVLYCNPFCVLALIVAYNDSYNPGNLLETAVKVAHCRSKRELIEALHDPASRVFDEIRRFYKGVAVAVLPKGVRKKITGFVKMAGRHSFKVNETPTTVAVSLFSVLDALSESAPPSVFVLNDGSVRCRAGILGGAPPYYTSIPGCIRDPGRIQRRCLPRRGM